VRAGWALCALALLAGGCEGDLCERGTANIFALELWYLEDPSPILEYRGRFEVREGAETPSPGGRDLAFQLGDHGVYAGGEESFLYLQSYVGEGVSILGKLTDVGFGPELWTGTIECLAEP
jgi:hypothetical protein